MLLSGENNNQGPLPYGWDRGADGSFRENETEQRVIGVISGWHAAGLGYHTIARQLNEAEIPTKKRVWKSRKRGRSWKSFRCRVPEWKAMTVWRILRREKADTTSRRRNGD